MQIRVMLFTFRPQNCHWIAHMTALLSILRQGWSLLGLFGRSSMLGLRASFLVPRAHRFPLREGP